jgi:hypothetical protein
MLARKASEGIRIQLGDGRHVRTVEAKPVLHHGTRANKAALDLELIDAATDEPSHGRRCV